jgi:hypothetical protein
MIKRIIFFITVLLSIQAFSQRTSSSPYSFFGVGEEFGTQTVEQSNMGGIGAAYSTPYHLNLTNPAALADLRFSTYAFGLLNNDLRIRDADTDQSTSTTTLSYFSIGIPLSPKIAVIAGMQPTSAVGYSLINTIEDTEGNVLDLTQFAGTGSVNRLYGGFGIQVFKGFSVGMEVDYLFGNVQNSVLNLRDNVALATRNVEDSNIRGGSVKVGVQYKRQLKNDMHINTGVVAKLSNTLRASGREDLFSLTADLGVDFPRDTIFSAALNGRFERPLETTVGVGIGKNNKWYAELDYSFRDAYLATGYLNEAAQSFAYTNASRISFGGFYIPKYNSISSYWQRITFRAGVRYERTGLLANGIPGGSTFNSINDFGISFGLGLPIGKQYPSNLNFAFEYGQKGTQDNGLLQENYLNLRLSLSLNDRWFKKRRID